MTPGWAGEEMEHLGVWQEGKNPLILSANGDGEFGAEQELSSFPSAGSVRGE